MLNGHVKQKNVFKSVNAIWLMKYQPFFNFKTCMDLLLPYYFHSKRYFLQSEKSVCIIW